MRCTAIIRCSGRRAWRQLARSASRAERQWRLSPAREPADDARADRASRTWRASCGRCSTRSSSAAKRAPEFWQGTVAFSRELAEAAEASPLWVKLTPTIVMLIGLWIAWNNYIRRRARPTASSPTSLPSTGSSPTNGISTSFTTSSSFVPCCGWDGCSGTAVTRVRSIASVPTARLMRSGSVTALPTGFSRGISILTHW